MFASGAVPTVWGGPEARDRPSRLRRVLRDGRAAQAPGPEGQAGDRRRLRAARGRHHRVATRRASSASGRRCRPRRRGGCARRDRHPARLHGLPREVARGVGARRRAARPRAAMGLDEAYADLTGVEKPLRVLRELIDGGEGADRHPDLGRRRAEPAGRQVLLRPRQARRLRGHGARGGVHPLRAPRRRAGCPASARRPPSGWPSSATRTVGQLQEADEAQLAARFGDRTARYLKARAPFTTTRRWRPSPARRSRCRPSAPSTRTSRPTPSWRTILRKLSRELCEGLQAARPARAHGGDQGPARGLDDGHARAHASRRHQRRRAGHRDRGGAAARVRAAARRCGCSACGWRASTTWSRTSRRRRVAPVGQLALPL